MRKKLNRIMCVIMVVTMFFILATVAFAAEMPEEAPKFDEYVVEVDGSSSTVSPRLTYLANTSGTANAGEEVNGIISGVFPAKTCKVVVNCKYKSGSGSTCWLKIGSWNQRITCDGVSRVIYNNEGQGPTIGETGGIWTLYNITGKMVYVIHVYYD